MLGIFDSGSGGLTVLKEVKKILPRADIVYFGDLKNNPYGEKSPEEIGILTVLGFKKLIENGVTHIVSACNSASAHIVLPYLKELKIKPVNIIEMVGPTVKAFKNKKDSKILLVATEATVRSGVYQEAFQSQGMEIEALALPYLARAIEEGNSGPAILGMIGAALEEYNGTYDTLVLSCTHYPLVADYFQRSTPQGVIIFDPAKSVAEEVAKKYEKEGKSNIKFLISKDSKFFRRKVEEFFNNQNYSIDVIG